MLMPLSFVVLVSMIKDIFEDLKRHQSDKQENTRKVWVGSPETGKFVLQSWMQIHVGMIVKIMQDEFFPADLVLLNSSAPKGICYIETKNLDGETNLKHKQGVKELVDFLKSGTTENGYRQSERSERDEGVQNQLDSIILNRMKGGYVECENPNEMLYKFEGTLGLGGDATVVPLCPDQMLLRGSSLRNTEYAYGLVTFTGHETKIMKNSVGSKSKFSRLERATNNYILLIVVIQATISLTGAIFNTVWQNINFKSLNYYLDLESSVNPYLNFIIQLGTWFLMVVNIVPISLMVTLEIVKFV